MWKDLMFAGDLLLIGEAKEIQMMCVMDIIHQFNDISGQEVSEENMCLMFSKNVSRNLMFVKLLIWQSI